MTEDKRAERAKPLVERIEDAYDAAISARSRMHEAAHAIEGAEETAKVEAGEAWTGAKNNDVRRMIVLNALAGDDVYQQARAAYRRARDEFRIHMLEVDRLRLLVDARAAGVSTALGWDG